MKKKNKTIIMMMEGKDDDDDISTTNFDEETCSNENEEEHMDLTNLTESFRVPILLSNVDIDTASASTRSIQQPQPQLLLPVAANILNEDYSYSHTISSFSLGNLEDCLREDTKSIKSISTNTYDDDDDDDDDDNCNAELLNLEGLEKELAFELQNLENDASSESSNCATPNLERSINNYYMNDSKNWVSRTPSRSSVDQQDIEEDFATAADAEAEAEAPTYRSPSPPNPFEQFFLPIVTGEDSSTFALAASRTCITNNKPTPQKVSSSTRSSISIASESIRTEDFASATDEFSVNSDLDDISLHDDNQRSTIFNDVLGRQAILEETPEEHEIDMSKKSKRNKKHTMATTKKTVTTPEPEPVSTPSSPPPVTEPGPEPGPEPTQTPAPPTSTPMMVENKEFDVVEHVYEGAKSVWAFGKGIIVFSPFMGVAEGAATKMLSITTGVSSLEDADKHIKSTLSNVDKEFIDPAILKLWATLGPIVGKSEEVLMSVLGVVSKKVPMLEGYKKPESTTCTVVEVEKVCDEAFAPETSKPAVVV